jgi:hypothetical protein
MYMQTTKLILLHILTFAFSTRFHGGSFDVTAPIMTKGRARREFQRYAAFAFFVTLKSQMSMSASSHLSERDALQ